MDEVKKYAFTTVLDAYFEEVLTRIRDALQSEGFGIITEIDVKATLKKKLNKEFRKYMILGACNTSMPIDPLPCIWMLVLC